MYVERIYILVCLFANIYLIKKLWELIFKSDEHTRELSWLPVLFWITIPVCFWSFSNNMHENTVSIFILLAVIFIYKTVQSKELSLLPVVLAGVFVFLASFSKGLPGLFPIAVPFVFLYKKHISFKKAALYAFVLLLIVASIYALLLLSSQARESLYNYFVLRLLKRVNDVPTTNTYFYTLFRAVVECGIMLGIALIVKLSTRHMLLERTDHHARSISFLMIGALGILPLMLTLVQKGFYMVPALPFLAIGVAVYISPQINILITKLDKSKLLPSLKFIFIAVAIASITLPVLNIGKTSRDQDKLADIHLIGRTIPEKSVINCSPELLTDWSLQTYLVRYYFISLDINVDHDHYLCSKQEFESESKELLENYTIELNDLNSYVLLKKR